MSFRDTDNPEGCTMRDCYCGTCGEDEEGFRYKQTGDSRPAMPEVAEERVRFFRRFNVSLSAPSQAMVTFIVGPDNNEQTFVIHKKKATAISPFFKAIFESDMEDGQTRNMRLEDIEGEIFGMLVHYLYSQELDQAAFVKIIRADDNEVNEYNILLLAKLWKLAERVLIADLQNTIMVELLHRRDSVFKEGLKKFAEYVCSTNGSFEDEGPEGALKRMLFELLAYNKNHDIFMAVMEILPNDIALQISLMMKEKLPVAHEQRSLQVIQEKFFVEI